MNIIFMGSPDFACPTLEKLINSEHTIQAVYAQPPRPAGRGQKERKTPVHILSEQHNLTVRTPERLKGEALEELLATPADVIVVVAYGLLLPKAVLDHAICLNLHPSALPRWRGAAPLQHTLLNGDDRTDICIMKLDEGMDTGPVYMRQELCVPKDMTCGTLHDVTACEGGDMMLHAVNNLTQMDAIPQEDTGSTLAHKITPEMRKIDWSLTATKIHNKIRAFSPFPTATTLYGKEVWKFIESIPDEQTHTLPAGNIIEASSSGIVVACGDGTALRILRLQRPSKKPLPVANFMQGFTFKSGDSFS